MADMTAAMAREICVQAHKYGALEEDPTKLDDTQILSYVPDLIQLSRTAYDRGVRSDTIMEILFAAQVEPTKPGEFEDVYARHNATPPAVREGASPEAPAPVTDQASHDAPGAPAQGEEIDINSIYPGYDDKKATEIKKSILESAASGDLTEEEWAKIQAYEAANEERSGILKLEPKFKPKEQPVAKAAAAPTDGDYGSASDLESAYQSGALGSDRIQQEGLPVPSAPQGEPVLPVDITQESDEAITRLAMQYHSLRARTLWLISQEEGRAEAAKSLRDDAERTAYKSHFERIKSGLEKETATALEGARSQAKHEAADDGSVQSWRNRAVRHSIEARNMKALVEGYEDAEERLSREQSRREKLAQRG